MIVLHAQGFADKRGVSEIHVSQQEAPNVMAVARGTIDHATAGEGTELVSFQRLWPISDYGNEAAVVQVDAVTKTTLDGGESWSEMWHWFGTASSPWPLAKQARSSSAKGDESHE